MNTSQRKSEHIRIVLEEDVNSGLSNGLEKYQFVHNALPEMDFNEVDLSTSFLGYPLKLPLLISSMTGGNDEAGLINSNLATAAQKMGVALAVGSQRVGLEDSKAMMSFKVREFAPDILLFANIGAVQLNYGFSVNECQKAVDAIQANALFLHLNPLQEALQPEGNTNFKGLMGKIELVCKNISVPVIVKEVGWGISGDVARKLANVGVAAIDVAGAGGVSWSQVEKFRISTELHRRVAEGFSKWGFPTAESLVEVKSAVPALEIIASGGLHSGIDVAKCISLGASMVGMAGRLLRAATISSEKIISEIEEISLQMKVCMFAAGLKNFQDLKKAKLRKF
jgi:isopentenyl-diphosphate Delta-isomerase